MSVLYAHSSKGSTSIEPVAMEFQRIDRLLSEYRAFLQLPQARPLAEQLAEAGNLIEGGCDSFVPHVYV